MSTSIKEISCFFLLICFFSSSCDKPTVESEGMAQPYVDTLKTYTIKKGDHYSDKSELQLMNTPSIIAHITFDSSAIYTTADPVNQADVNKLIGFSDCGTHHQQNSARLGWSWNGNQLILYAYAYVDSTRITKTLGAVALNQPIACSVNAANNYYYFRAANYVDSIPRHCVGYKGVGYKLFPYFGGDETAPHEIRIAILEETVEP